MSAGKDELLIIHFGDRAVLPEDQTASFLSRPMLTADNTVIVLDP